MKFSSSTTSCEVNPKVSCISGMLRRLFCSNSLPTHPSDNMSLSTYPSDHHSIKAKDDELCLTATEKIQQKVSAEASPGVVARLMGLESMPFDHAKATSTRSISRSRSMNSVDSLRQLESIKGRNRRVNSFRERPTYLELEDENFYILSFESVEFGSKQRKTENGLSGVKQRRKEKPNNKSQNSDDVYLRNKENLHVNYKDSNQKVDDKVIILQKASQKVPKLKDSSNILRPIDHNSHQSPPVGVESLKIIQASEEAVTRRKKKKKDEILNVEKPVPESDKSSPNSVLEPVPESDSDKSSPNSVLDFADTQNSEKLSRLTGSKSRRTLYEELESYRKLKLISDNREAKQTERICADPWNKVSKYVHVCRGIRRLAERDAVERNWLICKSEIGGDIGLEILDQLLGELVDQLVEQSL